MSRHNVILQISNRLEDLSAYLTGDRETELIEQRHLDADACEHVYWHAGYRAALNDVLNLLQATVDEDRNVGSQSGYLSDAPDGQNFH